MCVYLCGFEYVCLYLYVYMCECVHMCVVERSHKVGQEQIGKGEVGHWRLGAGKNQNVTNVMMGMVIISAHTDEAVIT